MEYQTMLYGGLSGALLSLIIAIIVFIKLNISEVIEDLTGFSFHKWVKKLQAGGRAKQEQKMKPITREIQPRRDVELEVAVSGSVAETELLKSEGPSTDRIAATELLEEKGPSLDSAAETELLAVEGIASGGAGAAEQLTAEPTATPEPDFTELLTAATADTEFLVEDAMDTELLSAEMDETELLDEDTEETTLLAEPESESNFLKELDVVIVHTNMTI